MDPRRRLCSRCGGSNHELVGTNRLRCVECGLESTFAVLSTKSPPPVRTPEEQAQLSRLMASMSRRDESFANAPFSPFALDERWTGVRSFGGWGGSNGATDHLSIAHGDPTDRSAPLVRVETRLPQQVGLDGARVPALTPFVIARELVQHLWHETGDLPDHVRAGVFPHDDPEAFGKDPTASWAEATLPVDGAPVEFRVLEHPVMWLGLGQIAEELFIGIMSRQWSLADTGLVAVTDFEVYAAGSQQIEDDMRRRHENPDA